MSEARYCQNGLPSTSTRSQWMRSNPNESQVRGRVAAAEEESDRARALVRGSAARALTAHKAASRIGHLTEIRVAQFNFSTAIGSTMGDYFNGQRIRASE